LLSATVRREAAAGIKSSSKAKTETQREAEIRQLIRQTNPKNERTYNTYKASDCQEKKPFLGKY